MRLFLSVVLFLFLRTSFGQTIKSEETFALGKTITIASKVLNEIRTLNIYLPEGYKAEDTTHYPVIYLLDGSADEDFIHVVGLVQFNTFPWVNSMPRSIVVGIANTDRKRDYTFPTTIAEDKKKTPTSGGSAKFIDFIEKELQPFIDKQYKTSGTKTIIGESLGGLLATEILYKRPMLFDNYIIISPSLWWDNGSVIKEAPYLPRKKNINVYIGVGKEGLAPTAQPHVMEVDANILADKLRSTQNPHLKVIFDYFPEETHATIGHIALFTALRKISH